MLNQGINLVAIYIANALGVTLLGMSLYGNRWRFSTRNRENRILLFMTETILLCCVVDPLEFGFDGRPGLLSYIIVYYGNLFLYLVVPLFSAGWVLLISEHLRATISPVHKKVLLILNGMAIALLVVNFFTPLFFGVDAENRYFRGPLFPVFFFVAMGQLLDGIVVYFIARKKGGILKFFPATIFVVPFLLGVAIQMSFYGVSTIWPFMAVSMGALMSSLQNELIFQDTLTGLCGRFYLDTLKRQLSSRDQGKLTAMMLDLNNFKSINDRYGHSVGDDALIRTAGVLTEAVGSLGTVIRYAGDEFVILLNTQDKELVDQCVERIHQGFRNFNKNSGKPYHLSAAVGSCSLDIKNQSVDELMNEVDRRMFENKREQYEHGDIRNRRKR